MKKLLFPVAATLFAAACAVAPKGGVQSTAKDAIHPGGSIERQAGTGTPVQLPVDGVSNIKDHPVTSVVVTQCNLIVAVYMTMSDGRLIRFDKTNAEHVPADQLVEMAHTAGSSERVEVSCNEQGEVGTEPFGGRGANEGPSSKPNPNSL